MLNNVGRGFARKAFAALAEPRRKEIVSLLAQNREMTAMEIVQKFKVSGPAISQHLKVLREHNLVEVDVLPPLNRKRL